MRQNCCGFLWRERDSTWMRQRCGGFLWRERASTLMYEAEARRIFALASRHLIMCCQIGISISSKRVTTRLSGGQSTGL